ncbi:MAG: hypothetical protein KUG73_04345 [Pseudomonadales bacterium]|nr:hypothetical protein [Pseudomonadales bacterium]
MPQMDMRLMLSIAACVLLSGLFGLTFTDVSTLGVTAGDEAGWDDLPASWQAPAKNTTKRLSNMSLWGSDASLSAKQQGGKVSADVLPATVDWVFNGIINDGSSPYALIAAKPGEEAKPFVIGDTLPSGEVLETIGLDWLRFTLPDAGEEVSKDQSRQLYEVKQ